MHRRWLVTMKFVLLIIVGYRRVLDAVHLAKKKSVLISSFYACLLMLNDQIASTLYAETRRFGHSELHIFTL